MVFERRQWGGSGGGGGSGGSYSAFPTDYDTVRIAHGVFGVLAWVVFFPLGAVLIRVLQTPRPFWVHVGIQIFALAMLVINAGTGIWMAKTTHKV